MEALDMGGGSNQMSAQQQKAQLFQILTKYGIKTQADAMTICSKIKSERKELRIKLDAF